MILDPWLRFQIIANLGHRRQPYRLLFGDLVADVPEQAVGFQVETPSGIVTDLSTKFEVNVNKNGQSDVHVIKGMVEATARGQNDAASMLVTESSAVRMSPESELKPVPFKEKELVQFDKSSNTKDLNYHYFPFDDPDISRHSEIVDHGSSGPVKVGSIDPTGNKEAWLIGPGKFGNALFFAGKGAHIKTNVQGIDGETPRTVMFWTRLPKNVETVNAYSFVNWGVPGSLKGNKWQIGWNPNSDKWSGRLGAIRTEFGGGYVIGTTDLRDGRWHHVCSVFLGGRNVDVSAHIRHYVDGKLEGVSGFNQMRINTDTNHRTLGMGNT